MGSIREASCWQHQYYKKVGWGAGKVEKDKERKYFLKKPKKNPKKTKQTKKPNKEKKKKNKTFSVVSYDRAGGNGHKLKHNKLGLNIREKKTLYIVRVNKH